MSRPTSKVRAIAPLLASVVLLGMPALASAQESRPDGEPTREATIQRLGAQIDSISAEFERLEPVVLEAEQRVLDERARRDAEKVDRQRLGPFTIYTFAGQSSLVAEAVRAVEAYYDRWAPGWKDAARPGAFLVYSMPEQGLMSFPTVPERVLHVSAPRKDGVPGLRRVLLAQVGTYLWASLPEPLREWSPHPLVGKEERGGLEPDAVYRLLVGIGSPAVISCLQGDTVDCWSALGTIPRGPTEWYPAEQRRERALRAQTRGYSLPATAQPYYDACSAGNDEACDRVLAAMGWEQPPPLQGLPRNLLVNHAITVGGPGAYARVRATNSQDPMEILAEASGLDPHELVADWLQATVGQRIHPQAELPGTFALTLLWSLGITGVAVLGGPRSVS